MHKLVINNMQWYHFDAYSGFEIFKEPTKEDAPIIQKYIGNFLPWVDAVVDMVKDGSSEQYIRFHLEIAIEGGNTDITEVLTKPLKELGKIDWPNDIDSRCILNPDGGKVNAHIANAIRLQCATAKVEKVTMVNRLGTNFAEQIPVFCAGDRLIWPEGIMEKPKVEWNPPADVRLAIDPDCPEEDAVAGMMDIVNLSPEVGAVLFAQNLLYVMREAYVAIGINPRVIVFLYGLTGCKKTTYSRFHTQLYNRDVPLKPLTRLNATIAAAVGLLYEQDDCVMVLDDLFPAQDREIHRQQEKTLLEITRIIADGIEPARMRWGSIAKKPPRCGVLFTGEYYIGSGSDAARLLPINLATPIDNEKLTACQNQPLTLSTFYNYYINWYISNFSDIVDLVRGWCAEYRNVRTDVHDRLQETQFCLEAAYKLFLSYCTEKGFISHEIAVEQYQSYYQYLRSVVTAQNDRVNKAIIAANTAAQEIDYLAMIRSLYRDGRFTLSDSVKHFNRDIHDGVIHNDYLHLRRDALMTKLKKINPSADFRDAVRCLIGEQALKLGKKGYSSVKLHGGGRRLNFYAIRLWKLK